MRKRLKGVERGVIDILRVRRRRKPLSEMLPFSDSRKSLTKSLSTRLSKSKRGDLALVGACARGWETSHTGHTCIVLQRARARTSHRVLKWGGGSPKIEGEEAGGARFIGRQQDPR